MSDKTQIEFAIVIDIRQISPRTTSRHVRAGVPGGSYQQEILRLLRMQGPSTIARLRLGTNPSGIRKALQGLVRRELVEEAGRSGNAIIWKAVER